MWKRVRDGGVPNRRLATQSSGYPREITRTRNSRLGTITSIINRNEPKRAGSVERERGGRNVPRDETKRDEESECFHSIRAVTREYKPLETADNERRPISKWWKEPIRMRGDVFRFHRVHDENPTASGFNNTNIPFARSISFFFCFLYNNVLRAYCVR